MGSAVKTDNHNLAAKLDLRRYFLKRYHVDEPPAVMDCCCRSQVLWTALRNEFAIGRYWGLDVKKKPGRLSINSERILSQRGWVADVIDVDTWGSPWRHWLAICQNAPGPLTIFLTVGQLTIGGGNADRTALAAMGLRMGNLPNSLGVKVIHLAVRYGLAKALDHGLKIEEAMEADSNGSARYIGVRLKPGR